MTKEQYEALRQSQKEIKNTSLWLAERRCRLHIEGELMRTITLAESLLCAAYSVLDIPLLRTWREFQKKDET